MLKVWTKWPRVIYGTSLLRTPPQTQALRRGCQSKRAHAISPPHSGWKHRRQVFKLSAPLKPPQRISIWKTPVPGKPPARTVVHTDCGALRVKESPPVANGGGGGGIAASVVVPTERVVVLRSPSRRSMAAPAQQQQPTIKTNSPTR